MQLKAGYLKGLCQARPKWVNKNNQRRSSDNPGVQAEELEREREKRQRGRGRISEMWVKKNHTSLRLLSVSVILFN